MGSSSILAALIITSITHLLHITITQSHLIYLVCYVEQLLTAGGGWQDQIGGLIKNFKLTKSFNYLPLIINVKELNINNKFMNCFENRTFLIYTGQQVCLFVCSFVCLCMCVFD